MSIPAAPLGRGGRSKLTEIFALSCLIIMLCRCAWDAAGLACSGAAARKIGSPASALSAGVGGGVVGTGDGGVGATGVAATATTATPPPELPEPLDEAAPPPEAGAAAGADGAAAVPPERAGGADEALDALPPPDAAGAASPAGALLSLDDELLLLDEAPLSFEVELEEELAELLLALEAGVGAGVAAGAGAGAETLGAAGVGTEIEATVVTTERVVEPTISTGACSIVRALPFLASCAKV